MKKKEEKKRKKKKKKNYPRNRKGKREVCVQVKRRCSTGASGKTTQLLTALRTQVLSNYDS